MPTSSWLLAKLVATARTRPGVRLPHPSVVGVWQGGHGKVLFRYLQTGRQRVKMDRKLMKHDRWSTADSSLFYLDFDPVKIPTLTLAKVLPLI